jgi:hypothetical protein
MSVVVGFFGSDEKEVVERDGMLSYIFERLGGFDVLRGCDSHVN